MRAIPRIKTRDTSQYCHGADCSSDRASQASTTTSAPSKFRHDPYGASPLSRVYVDTAASSTQPRQESVAPSGTLHAELWGLVSFLPYPTTTFEMPPDAIYPDEQGGETVRVFVGQLPYFITEMQLGWILYTFGGKHAVVRPERILKRNAQTGERQPTGCIHAIGTAEGLAQMSRLMHKRLLIDDTGVWFCRKEIEYGVLWDYCQAMKKDIKLRPWERPYDSVVVQEATSGSHLRRQQRHQEQQHQRHQHQHQHQYQYQQQQHRSQPNDLPEKVGNGVARPPPPPYYAGSNRSSGAAAGHGRYGGNKNMDAGVSAGAERDDIYMAH